MPAFTQCLHAAQWPLASAWHFCMVSTLPGKSFRPHLCAPLTIQRQNRSSNILVRQLDGGRILIGAYQDNTFGTVAGAVYLYSTNGSLLTIFTNSAPYGSFGSSVPTVGSDRILISAPSAGRVYLFDTNAKDR